MKDNETDFKPFWMKYISGNIVKAIQDVLINLYFQEWSDSIIIEANEQIQNLGENKYFFYNYYYLSFIYLIYYLIFKQNNE